MTQPDSIRRSEYRLHVPSLLILALVLGALLAVNLHLRVISEFVQTRGTVSHALRDSGLGWPCCWQQRSSMEVDLANEKELSGNSRTFDEAPILWLPLIGDLGIALVISVLAAAACEAVCRRRVRTRVQVSAAPIATVAFTRRRIAAVSSGILLLGIGVWFALTGWEESSRLASGDKNLIFGNLDVHLSRYESIVSTASAARIYISQCFLISVLFGLAGIFALARRFSLKALFLGSVLAAVAGYAPYSIHSATTAYLRIHLNVPLSRTDIDRMRAQLQPEAVFEKMPPALLKTLAIRPGQAIDIYALDAPAAFDGSLYSSMTLKFNAALTPTQIDTLTDFYWHYYRTLTLESTTERIPASLEFYDGLSHSLWTKADQSAWDAEWTRAKVAAQ